MPKYFRGLLGNLFREEVAGLDSLTSDIITPFLPQADRSGLSPVPGSQRSLGTPQNEQGARYPAARRAILLIVTSIEGGGSAVFFANRVGVRRVADGFDVRCADLGRKHGLRRSPFRESLIDDCIRSACEDAFRERLGLREQRPRPEAQRESGIC